MLKAALARYRSFVREPDVARLMAMALIARMPLGTLSFAMLMHVRDFTGSFADAGIAVGAYYAAAAAFSPLIGRIVDRRGPKGVLLVTGIVCPLALLVIVVARPFGISLPIVVTAAAVAGAFAPPITVLTRTMWRYRFDDEAVRKIAFTLDGVLIELAFTLGPVLIAALIAIASPSVAFAAAWGFVTLSVPTFIASPALKYWRHEPHAERHLLGPLTDSRLIVIYLSTMLMTASFGFLEVGLPGFATAAGAPALGGVLIAINSIGSVIGGLAYGGLHARSARRAAVRRRVCRHDVAARRACVRERRFHHAGVRDLRHAHQRDGTVALCDRGLHLVGDLHRLRDQRGYGDRRRGRRARRRQHGFPPGGGCGDGIGRVLVRSAGAQRIAPGRAMMPPSASR